MNFKTLAQSLGCSALLLLSACGGNSGSSSTSSSSSSSTSSSSSSSTSSSSSSSSNSSSGISGLLKGVNLAGADFGEGALPGVYGEDYIYPGQSQVDYFKTKGMNLLRVPFRWERLQRALNQSFDSTEFNRLHTLVSAATASGMYVMLDPHNYARYNGNLIGSAQVPHSAFADFWGRLAEQYKNNPRVIFGLMNEPHTMPTEQWVTAANAAAQAIRNTGASNLITVPGNAWTGAHSWTQSWYGTPNASALLSFNDPGNNFAIEVHQYFDDGYAGVMPDCATNDGSQMLTEFTAWLAANNMRGFLGEFAGANNATCQQAIESALQYIENNDQYWIGWTWWAAGPWWTWQDYMFSIEPNGTAEAPQMQWLDAFLP